MSISNFYLCALPKATWGKSDDPSEFNIFNFISDALSCERRIEKGVNLENEHLRYTLLCQRLEQAIIQSRKIKPANNGHLRENY